MNNIKLVIFDVDGVMTDGGIYIDENGESFKKFNVKDGLAIDLLRVHGIKTAVVSGKASSALTKRCAQLNIDYVVTGSKNKLPKVKDICLELSINPSDVAFVGDDVIDLPSMEYCGLSVAPADAHQIILGIADIVTSSHGGSGVVREFCDLMLTSRFGNLENAYKIFLEKMAVDEVDNMEQ